MFQKRIKFNFLVQMYFIIRLTHFLLRGQVHFMQSELALFLFGQYCGLLTLESLQRYIRLFDIIITLNQLLKFV